MLGKIGNARLNFAQGIAGVINETGLFHKIVHAQRAGKTCRAAGGQGVVGAGKIIAQCFRHILAQENAARVLYAVQNGERVVHTNFQMLRGNDVHGVNGLVHIVRHNDLAVGVHAGAGDGGAGQLWDLHFQLGLYGLGQLGAVRYQHGAGQLVMLGLAQQVSCHPGGVAAAIRQHQNLRRPGDHINANLAEHFALGGGNVNIAGADDLIHRGNALGAVSQRGHGLGAAGLEDLVNTGNHRSSQDGGIHLAIRPGGGGHHDLLHTGHLGGDHIHQYGAGVSGGTARHIHTGFFNRGIFLAQHNAGGIVHHKVLVDLVLMEGADVGGGHLQGSHKILTGGFKGFVNFRLAHPQLVQLGVVKFQSVIFQGGITAGAHIGDNGIHGCFHAGFRADITVQDFFRLQSVKLKNADHLASASFILFSSSVSCAYLNL